MNYLLYILIIIIFISNKFLLFNEESLILFCFCCFCWLFYNNMNQLIFSNFENISISLKTILKTSYDEVIKNYKELIYLQIKKINLNTYFLNLKNYYLNLNYKLIIQLINLQKQKKEKIFYSKLIYINILEQQFNKLIISLILKKINKIIKIHIFYSKILKINQFICLKKINLREYLITIL